MKLEVKSSCSEKIIKKKVKILTILKIFAHLSISNCWEIEEKRMCGFDYCIIGVKLSYDKIIKIITKILKIFKNNLDTPFDLKEKSIYDFNSFETGVYKFARNLKFSPYFYILCFFKIESYNPI